MRICKLDQLPSFKNAVLTIGTYDGVHVAHQRIIKRINQLAAEIEGESVLITFDPHPRTVVNDNYEIRLLSPLEEKIDLLRHYGIQNLVVVPFTRAFSQQSPQDYIRQFLVANFQPKKVVIGYNHQFGQNRSGNIELLRAVATEYDFEVEELTQQQIEDIAVSSTKIRAALTEGKIETATTLLGHPYFIRGIVVKGRQLGKKIGFPTANMLINDVHKLIPKDGVYAVWVRVREQIYKGMLNIGYRPTFDGKNQTIEVNIFDFEEDIYGEAIQLDFVGQIRQEVKFVDINALVEQLNKDKKTALQMIQSHLGTMKE